MTDIFKSDFKLPPSVYIVAPGWRGTDCYYKIPDDAYVIALNKAVLIPTVYKVPWKFSAWLVADTNAPLQDWWEAAMLFSEIGIEGGKYIDPITRIFGYRVKSPGDFTFRHDPICNVPYPGSLCLGSTVLGVALQLCYWFMGEKCGHCEGEGLWEGDYAMHPCGNCEGTGNASNKVHLLGADMGTTDFTNEIQYKPGHFKYAMEGIRQWFWFMREKGIKVECLSVSPLEEYCDQKN